MIWNKFHTV